MSRFSKTRGFEEVECIGTIPLEEGAELHVSHVRVNGEDRADIRKFEEEKRKMVPKKGITLKPEKLEDLMDLVYKLQDKFHPKLAA